VQAIRLPNEGNSVTTDIILYASSSAIIVWGVAHIIPARSVVAGFGPISEDNKRIITMEWVAEGLTLCFIGLLVLLITALDGSQDAVSRNVYRISAAMLLVMAGWTLLTGARTSIVPIKVCPIVKTVVAALFLVGSLV
jgi:hypothetical protein